MNYSDYVDSATRVGPFDEGLWSAFVSMLTRSGGAAFRAFSPDEGHLAFLRATNGGVPLRSLFTTRSGVTHVAERFLHIASLPPRHPLGASGVDVSFLLASDRLHDRLVPFAELFAGDMLCLDYGRLIHGRPSVVVWLHEECSEEEFVVDDVADNFDEFLKLLRAPAPTKEFRRSAPAAWVNSGTMPTERIQSAMDIDPATVQGPLDESLLQKFEIVLCRFRELGLDEIDLDPSFISFLRTCNGGRPKKPTLTFNGNEKTRVVEFAHMVTMDHMDPRRRTSMWSLWLGTRYGISRGLLPFATCDQSRVLCFDYSRLVGKRPAISLSETTGNMNPNVENRGVNYPVAENFDALLDLKWF